MAHSHFVRRRAMPRDIVWCRTICAILLKQDDLNWSTYISHEAAEIEAGLIRTVSSAIFHAQWRNFNARALRHHTAHNGDNLWQRLSPYEYSLGPKEAEKLTEA
jgi:hypothetical protein